ncbi:amino acid adenylation domain-containing protein [Streptomyces cyaneochromogenes]|uniref:Amino acid adenylation domain-containing protein n=1 Tax=Streptomyces cyaneochromogenes TaxID=2496836 RepID=A0A3Q9EZQ8_9ACTN|nr:non-ribosomal peptide synthetase [Streptomyces cyaneochromogenes]AZQ39170.1 amino acid adenylation domain-containing protein [Streptomyces cyaneochromogenes]
MAGRPAVEDVLPLSPMQEGMVFHALYDEQGHDVYTGQMTLRLEGPLDGERMSAAVGKLLARHANLRAAFRTQRSGRSVQVIRSEVKTPWQVTDLSLLPPDEREPALERLLAEDRAERFDLTRPPLLRCRLVTFDELNHRLVISSHHLLWDGWSAPVLVRELFQLYASDGGPDTLPRVRPYRDYLAWLARQDRTAAEQSWQAALAGLDEPSLIAADARDLPAEEPERLVRELSEQDTEALTAAARTHGLTVSTVLQGLWAVLLGRLTGRTDVVLGATVSGRDADVPGIESMVGLFINTLPVRARLRPEEPLADLLVRLQSEQSALLDHRHLGLADIQRAAGHTVLFDTLLVFESYPIDDAGIARALGPDGLRMTGVSVHDATHYPLNLTALPGARLTLTLSHRPTVLDHAAVTRVAAQLDKLLRDFIARPATPVAQLGLPPAEGEPPALNESPLPHPTVRALFEDQASRTPDAPAVLHGETTLTFAELDARADRLAAALAERGAGPESVVAVALPRTPDLVTALLAVLKAGAACMPIDPGYPPDRIALMLDDAEPRLVICDAPTAQQLGIKRELTCPPDAEAAAVRQRPPLSPEHPAYIIFTSGSTGRPKGVIGTQQALANRLAWGRELGADPAGVRVSKSPLSFIDGLTELLGALVAGEAVALADDEATGDPTALAALADRHRATLLTAVPSLFATFVESAPPDAFSSVRTWISSGEPLSGELAEAITRRWPQARLVNLYGCSEAAGDSLVHLHDGGEGPVPLGQPIANTRVHVLDPFLRPSPLGAVGELYVAGTGLARGYLGQPGRTAERFVADPFGPPGSRLYRTGDLARLRADGTVEFLGRADDQVKIRGFRVEPGEIEAAARALPGVGRAAVVVREDGAAPRRLVAYVVPKAQGAQEVHGEPEVHGAPGTQATRGASPSPALDPATLRRALAERLPAHLVPSAVVVLDALPLTPSGKLDRRALPAPDFTGASPFEPPRTEPEKVLCGLFAEVLGLERVGVHDDFFEHGGDSIVSVRLADRARRAGLALSPRDVFTHRTPAGLARALPHETGPAPEEFTPTGAPLVSLSQSQLDNVKARWRTR